MPTVEFELLLELARYKRAQREARFELDETAKQAKVAGEKFSEAFTTLDVRPLADIRKEAAEVQTAFDRVRRSADATGEDIERAAVAARRRLSELRREASGTGAAFERLNIRSFDEIEDDIADIRRAFERVRTAGTSTASDIQRAWNSANDQIRTLRREASGTQAAFDRLNIRSFDVIEADIQDVRRAFRQVQISGRASANDIQRAWRAARDQVAQLRIEQRGLAAESAGGLGRGGAVRGELGALLAGGSLIAATRSIADAGLAAEGLERSFAVAAGGAEQGREQFAFVREEADRLGFSLRETAGSFSDFSNATRGTSIEGEATRNTFLGVLEAGRALGRSTEQTNGALLALGQIAGKGKVSMEELRGQLGERLPGAMQIAARAMGVTTAELEDLVAGGLSAEEFLPRFGQQLRKEFGGAAADAADSAAAAFGRFQTKLFDLEVQLSQSGLLDAMGDVANFIGDVVIPALATAIPLIQSFGAAWAAQVKLFQDVTSDPIGFFKQLADGEIDAATLLADSIEDIWAEHDERRSVAAGERTDNTIAEGERELAAERDKQAAIEAADTEHKARLKAAADAHAARLEAARAQVEAETIGGDGDIGTVLATARRARLALEGSGGGEFATADPARAEAYAQALREQAAQLEDTAQARHFAAEAVRIEQAAQAAAREQIEAQAASVDGLVAKLGEVAAVEAKPKVDLTEIAAALDISKELAANLQSLNALPALFTGARAPSTAVGQSGAGLPRLAQGGPLGPLSAPGGDHTLGWFDRREWVIDPRTRAHYGDAYLRALQQLKVPRFAQGGPVERALSQLPQAGAGGGGGTTSAAPFILQLPSGAQVDAQTSAEGASLVEREIGWSALKHGAWPS